MIVVKKLTKYVLGEPLFEGASFVLHKGDKVGLVGPNGCGKSTLLKILIGQIERDDGDVRLEGERVGYLSQEFRFKDNETVENFLSVSDGPKAKSIMKEVGLGDISSNPDIDTLSGGQKTRLALAKILLDKPSVLLLDEPTNHLDLEGLAWLERYIRDFRGSVLIVSHDRRLLDNSVNKILEIDPANHAFAEYAGGYTAYAMEKEKRTAQWEGDYQRQQKEKRRMELWLALKKQEAHVHPDPAKGKQIRAMEKRLKREIYDNEIARPKDQEKIANLALQGQTASAKLIVRATDIAKDFPGKPLLRDIGFELRGRERVLLAGENGCGKTTLLKILTGDLELDSGEIRFGERVQFGYFAQEHEILDPDKTIMDEFLGTDCPLNSSRNPRSALGAFLFGGQRVFAKVSSLSLGERVRLMFAKLTSQENELLILDEPTNHLDIQSREVIEDALLNYKGALLVVSHDRYFLDKIAVNRTLTIHKGVIREDLV